jgi:hypothetical protein
MRNWNPIIKSVWQAIRLPFFAYFGAGAVLLIASGHSYVTRQLKEKGTPKNRTQLNMRLQGYDKTDVAELWGILDRRALKTERLFLQMDLLFPIFYAGAFAVALRQIWAKLGKTSSPILLVAPAVITSIADWTENLVQLAQLRRYVESGSEGLQEGWIQVASAATVTKLLFFFGTLGLLVYLAVYRVVGRRLENFEDEE